MAHPAPSSPIFNEVFSESDLASVGRQRRQIGQLWQHVFQLALVVQLLIIVQRLDIIECKRLKFFHAEAG